MSTKYKLLIKTDIYESLESIKNPIGVLDGDDEVELVDINLGKYFQFSKVITTTLPINKEVFVRSCFLAPSDSGQEPSLHVTGQAEEVYVPNPIKIKDAEVGLPYIEGNCVYIVLDTGLLTKQELADEEINIKLTALEKLVNYYGKEYTEAHITEFASNPFNLITISEPYFPSRPGKGIMVKLCVKKHYFDAFESKSFEKFAIENIHKDFISVTFKSSELEKTVKKLVKILEKYDSDIGRFSGKLSGINYKSLSSELRNFLSKFKKLLSINDVSLENPADNKIEIGFSMVTDSVDCEQAPAYKLEYVLYFEPYGRFISIGLNNLTNSVSTAMAKLLISHKDLLSASLAGLGWMDMSKQFFAGEFKIDFTPPTARNSNAKKPKTQLEAEIKNITADHAALSVMDHKKSLQLTNVKKDPKFKATTSQLLAQSSDVVGDNFLINLPEILANVDDLNTLYGLVFDKVSIKDLVDLLMESMTENLNIPDVNEIKLRGVLKTLDHATSIGLIDHVITSAFEMQKLSLNICDNYKFGKEDIDKIIKKIETPSVPVEFYFIHYNNDDELAGILVDGITIGGTVIGKYEGDLAAKLLEKSIKSCETLLISHNKGNFKISDYFQSKAINEILCHVMSEGLPKMENVCTDMPFPTLAEFNFFSDLRIDIIDIFKSLSSSVIIKAIDAFIKDLFKMSKEYQTQIKLQENMPSGGIYATNAATANPSLSAYQISPSGLFDKFATQPKINMEMDKLNLTKKKLLNKAPNVNIDIEKRKKDVNFTLPSKKSVNPSFDFAKYEFTSMSDIFGSATQSIEQAITDGIEKGLVQAFKGILNSVLDSMNMDMPNIDSPDFGGLDMNDLLDASNGISADGVANMILDGLNFNIQKSDPCSDFSPSASDVKNAFSQMSACSKPLELTRVMKGQRNKKDYENMTACIQDENMRQTLDFKAFGQMMDVVSDFADLKMLEELESAYNNKEVMVSVCKDNGIPYCLRDIKATLEAKYSSFTDDEVCELIENIVEETKDSLTDAIGSLKEDFQSNLPFNEDPCSFMPKPNDIPAMNFVNDLAFDSIFNPIELEYKSEAVSFPDLLMQTTPSEEYVKLRLTAYDSTISEIGQSSQTGLFEINYKFVKDEAEEFEPDLANEDGGIYNQEFGNHYFGTQTPIYYLNNERRFIKRSANKINILENEKGEYYMSGGSTGQGIDDISVDKNLYVKKVDENLLPMPELKLTLLNTEADIRGYGTKNTGNFYDVTHDALDVLISPEAREITNTNRTTELGYLDLGYRILFPNLSSAKIEIKYTDISDSESLISTNTWSNVEPPTIVHDINGEIGIGMKFPSVESLANPECIDVDTELIPVATTDAIKTEYVKGIAETLDYWMDEIIGTNTSKTYQGVTKIVYDGFDRLQQNQSVGGEEGRDSVDLIASLTLDMCQTYMRSFSQSELFETNEMLTFLFDTEDVNLFKVQDAKNAAKDEYNEDCGFTDDKTSKLKTSSIKKLIYLTIRIYLIDILTQGCFINSAAYDEELSEYLVVFAFQYMKAQLTQEKDSYYTVFSELYSKEYGEEIETNNLPSTSFEELCNEIWKDISPELPKIFPNAESSTLLAFLNNTAHFYGDESDFASFLYDTYMLSRSNPDLNSRFLIKLVYVDKNGKESFFTRDNANTIDRRRLSSEEDLLIRLCYVTDFRQITHFTPEDLFPELMGTTTHPPTRPEDYCMKILEQIGIAEAEADTLETFQTQLSKFNANYMTFPTDSDAEGTSAARYNTMMPVTKIKDQASYNYIYQMGEDKALHPHLLCIPIAQISTIFNNNNGYDPEQVIEPNNQLDTTGKSTHDKLKAFLTGQRFNQRDDFDGDAIRDLVKEICNYSSNHGKHGIYDFVERRMRSKSYFDLLRRTMISKMQQLKPETALAFQDTKNVIRMAILSLSQEKDNFEFIQQEPINVQLTQAQEVGTEPEFSPKARKMALMTVPLIIKGMAEMFDPNTKIASLIRKGADAAGMNIPPPVASLMALPFNIIPFAPGPPITPLGLTYLATSFLEPKERKKLSDIKRGKNTNPASDGKTLSPEEQMEQRAEAAIEAQQIATNIHKEITSLTKEFTKGFMGFMEDIEVYYNENAEGALSDAIGELDCPDTGEAMDTTFGKENESQFRYSSALANHLDYSQPYNEIRTQKLEFLYGDQYSGAQSTTQETYGGYFSSGEARLEEHTTGDPEIATRPYDFIKEEASLKGASYRIDYMFDHIFNSNLSATPTGDRYYTWKYGERLMHYVRNMNHVDTWYSYDNMWSNDKFNLFRDLIRAVDQVNFVLTRAFPLYCYSLAKIYSKYGLKSMGTDFDFEFDNCVAQGDHDPENSETISIKQYYLAYGENKLFNGTYGFFKQMANRHYHVFRKYLHGHETYKNLSDEGKVKAQQELSSRAKDRHRSYVKYCIGGDKDYNYRPSPRIAELRNLIQEFELYELDEDGYYVETNQVNGLYNTLVEKVLDNIMNDTGDWDDAEYDINDTEARVISSEDPAI